MRKTHFILFTFLSMPCLSPADEVRYYLQADTSNPLKATVTADTSALGAFSVSPPRNPPFSKMKSAPEIRCKTQSGFIKANYKNQMQCDEIRWAVDFKLLDDSAGMDVSEQTNLYSTAGWWVLFEWGNIPRLRMHSIIVCVKVSSVGYSDKCRRLPEPDSAPLILSWGHAIPSGHESGAGFNVYADDKQRILNGSSRSLLKSQYKYLKKVTSAKGRNEESIDIIWVGIDEKTGVVGGAAGDRTFISNYAFKDGKVSEENRNRLHWVSGHEIFHMLSSASYPLWVSESLAHYYGYKSLRKAGVKFRTPVELWLSGAERPEHSETGLYTANEMVEGNNDISYYGLFYDKGAAFWQELDDNLIEKGATLDEYLALLASRSTGSPLLGEKFIDEVEKVIGKKEFSRLSSKYLR